MNSQIVQADSEGLVDPLSELQMLLDVQVVPPCWMEVDGEWALSFTDDRQIRVSAVLRGHMWITAGTAEPLLLRAGDAFLLNSNARYVVGSAPDLPAEDGMTVIEAAWPDTVHYHVEPGKAGSTLAISGALPFDEATAALLINYLPEVSVLRAGTPGVAALNPVLELLAQEASLDLPGANAVRGHLTHVLFVQTLRAVLTSPDVSMRGLRALGDKRLRPALTLIHGRPGEPWTVATLASAAGMSRTAFALRFKDSVGLAPLDYLNRWRVQSAGRLLRATDRTVSSLATEFGFSTASSFIRTFKRVTGQSPASYRMTRIVSASRPGVG
jgi:AraC-like DNA-binding protein